MNISLADFVKRGWKTSRKGNRFKHVDTDVSVTIFEQQRSFKFCVSLSRDEKYYSQDEFGSVKEAQEAAYYWLWDFYNGC